MAKQGAPRGNQNAAKNSGRRVGVVSGAFGPVGAAIGGAYVGANRSVTGQTRQARSAAATGGTFGAVTGALAGASVAGPFGIIPGAAVGSVFNAALNYGGAKLGQKLTRPKKTR